MNHRTPSQAPFSLAKLPATPALWHRAASCDFLRQKSEAVSKTWKRSGHNRYVPGSKLPLFPYSRGWSSTQMILNACEKMCQWYFWRCMSDAVAFINKFWNWPTEQFWHLLWLLSCFFQTKNQQNPSQGYSSRPRVSPIVFYQVRHFSGLHGGQYSSLLDDNRSYATQRMWQTGSGSPRRGALEWCVDGVAGCCCY